jgi:hypothetical protein
MTKFSRHKWWIVTVLITAPLVAIAAVPNIFSPNTVISSAQVNMNFAGLDSRLTALETPATGLLRVHLTANQTLPTGSTRLDFSRDGVDFDVGQEFDTATDLFTAKAAGYYSITCNATVPTTTAGIYTVVQIQVNGTVVQEGGGNSVGAGFQVPNAATLVNLKVGDQVSCAGYTNSASSVSAGGPYFTVFTIAKH